MSAFDIQIGVSGLRDRFYRDKDDSELLTGAIYNGLWGETREGYEDRWDSSEEAVQDWLHDLYADTVSALGSKDSLRDYTEQDIYLEFIGEIHDGESREKLESIFEVFEGVSTDSLFSETIKERTVNEHLGDMASHIDRNWKNYLVGAEEVSREERVENSYLWGQMDLEVGKWDGSKDIIEIKTGSPVDSDAFQASEYAFLWHSDPEYSSDELKSVFLDYPLHQTSSYVHRADFYPEIVQQLEEMKPLLDIMKNQWREIQQKSEESSFRDLPDMERWNVARSAVKDIGEIKND